MGSAPHRLLQACATGADAPPGLEVAPPPACDAPPRDACEAPPAVVVPAGGVVHVSQRTYAPLHAKPIDWLSTRAPSRVAEEDALAVVTKLFADLNFFPANDDAHNATTLLDDHEDFAGTLSGGQRVKYELVRQIFLPKAFGADCPGLLLLDEIFSPLDPDSKALVQAALRAACPSAVVLAIYHADSGTCVPKAAFFTDVLDFEKQADGAMRVSRIPTCD